MKKDKWYDVILQLGATSTTGDPEGEIVKSEKLKVIELKDLEVTLNHFVGEIQQTPPVFSAIKINGQRAYDLARKGKVVEMKPRKVTIYAIENTQYDFPYVSFRHTLAAEHISDHSFEI